MHYANGDAVKVGDLAVFIEGEDEVAGVVTKLMSNCGPTCNLQITPVASRTTGQVWFPIAGQAGWYRTASSGFPLVPSVPKLQEPAATSDEGAAG